MIRSIYFEETSTKSADFIIDCVALCEHYQTSIMNNKEMPTYKVIKIFEKGKKDTFLGSRTISPKDYFFIDDDYMFVSKHSAKIEKKYPEYTL